MRTRTHPGEILREEFLTPLGITPHALAVALGVPATRISDIVHLRRGVTADTAARLSRFFGTSAAFWMNLQAAYDLSIVERDKGDDLLHIRPHPSAGASPACCPPQ
ncbi:HigA family addiction module antitoxin [Nitratidesulfovibrio sp.]|uniref:HigA family addiction module antitoxin n=1 Tax=Nitratidesulfovibrio sp. TaxID=2802297 RepID=UPI0033402171